MRRFAGIAAALALASGAAVAAAAVTAGGQESPTRVPDDRKQSGAVLTWESDQPGEKVRRLAVLAGRGVQLGVTVRDVDPAQPGGKTGAVVEDVRSGSAADKAGIRKGDVITEFDGERVRGARHLTRLVTETPEGRTVKAVVDREGTAVALDVTPDSGALALGEGDVEVLVPPMRFEGLGPEFERDLRSRIERSLPRGEWAWRSVGRPRLGVQVQSLDGQLGEYFGTSTGVLVNSVEADSPAAKAGLKAGDVVTAIDGKAVSEPSQLIEAVRDAKDGATLAIDYVRDRKAQSTNATLPEREAERPRRRQSARPI